ncbi:MAG: hypothetical protein WDN27_01730 [Candidatus Saccharibacteria bacterium]
MIITLLHHFAAAAAPTTATPVIDPSALPNSGTGDPTQNVVSIVLDIVFGIVASISLLMIVIGGFRYIVAHGDPNSTAQAKNTILYAIIGLLVTMVAYSIVIFVVKGVS